MVKPSSSLCNMSCKYCFYHSLARQRESYSYGQMSFETIERVIYEALKFAAGGPFYLSFQGGEPLLRGKEFFRFVLDKIREHNKKHSPVALAVQTNGLHIDDEWCRLFLEGNFLVGLSLDGEEEDNINRVDNAGNPVFGKVLASAKLLQRYGVDFNVLCVVTERAAKNIARIYKFFASQGFRHLQFIPCLKPLGSGYSPFCITERTYGDYLITLFDLYLEDIRNGNYVSVRHLDNFALLAKGQRAEQCGMNGTCGAQFVVEGDGTVFPCDFYCLDEFKLGNINETTFSDIARLAKFWQFIKGSASESRKCLSCAYYNLCRGGCKRERIDLEKCAAYKRFFDYALPALRKIY